MSLCLSVSQVGVLLKRLNVGSQKQHMYVRVCVCVCVSDDSRRCNELAAYNR